MTVLDQLPKWFERKPLVLLRLPDGFAHALSESKHGLNRFTLVREHHDFSDLKVPTLCLAEMPDGDSRQCFVGVITAKAAVATFDTRITVAKLRPLKLPSLQAIGSRLTGKGFKNAFTQKLKWPTVGIALTPKLSVAVISAIAQDVANRRAIENTVYNLPKFHRVPVPIWEQMDAVRTAIGAFGLSKNESASLVETSVDSDSTLSSLDTFPAHVLEDYAIARDAGYVPGYSLIAHDLTGHAVFKRGMERLDIYTANKGPLETMLGVDLIYFNESVGNIVMLQYKMLEPHRNPDLGGTDWIYRPDDQLESELARMRLPPLDGERADYRLHRSPFFFKFVKRKGDGETHPSSIISFDHLRQLLSSPRSRGPRGGVRLGFEGLEGIYLRDSDLIGLIRSGYIGTHRQESEALQPIIAEVARGNRALVLAWQRRVGLMENDNDEDEEQ